MNTRLARALARVTVVLFLLTTGTAWMYLVAYPGITGIGTLLWLALPSYICWAGAVVACIGDDWR